MLTQACSNGYLQKSVYCMVYVEKIIVVDWLVGLVVYDNVVFYAICESCLKNYCDSRCLCSTALFINYI